jgi:hypothetical protein
VKSGAGWVRVVWNPVACRSSLVETPAGLRSLGNREDQHFSGGRLVVGPCRPSMIGACWLVGVQVWCHLLSTQKGGCLAARHEGSSGGVRGVPPCLLWMQMPGDAQCSRLLAAMAIPGWQRSAKATAERVAHWAGGLSVLQARLQFWADRRHIVKSEFVSASDGPRRACLRNGQHADQRVNNGKWCRI